MLSFKSAFSLPSFTFIKKLCSYSLLSAIRIVSSAYLRLLKLFPAILSPACASSSPAFCMMYSPCKLNKQSDKYTALIYSFPNLEQVRCSLSSSNYCFLNHIQVSQETGNVVCSHFLKNFPWLVVIYTVKGFSIVNKAEVNVLLEFFCFFYDPMDLGNVISSSSTFSKSSLYILMFLVHLLLKLSLKDFERYFACI